VSMFKHTHVSMLTHVYRANHLNRQLRGTTAGSTCPFIRFTLYMFKNPHVYMFENPHVYMFKNKHVSMFKHTYVPMFKETHVSMLQALTGIYF